LFSALLATACAYDRAEVNSFTLSRMPS